MARHLASVEGEDRWIFLFEDLDAAGFPHRLRNPDLSAIESCLDWLAAFHARFLGEAPAGLWKVGTYWHLATRPDELQATEDPALKAAAADIDTRLNGARFQTLVHGDAKVANFCFGLEGPVAAVDFQYVGGGCGMKDVIYFLSSTLDSEDCERLAPDLLNRYFSALRDALPDLDASDLAALEAEWRALYTVAWADFLRFLAGWSPAHWKFNDYSRRMARAALAEVADP